MSRVWTGILGCLCAAAAAGAPRAFAQYPGRVNPNQPGNANILRATAVLEYTGDLSKPRASRLIPIAVWDGLQYQPGALYLAEPAPLAVLSGTQYELESAGHPKGFFDISEAEQLNGLWIGTGKYQAPQVARARPRPVHNMPYQVKDYDPDKPHFAHRPADEGNQNGATATAQNAPPVDPDRPTLHQRPSDNGSGSSDNSGSQTSSQPDVDPDRPTFRRRAATSDQASAATQQPAVDPDRPHLEYTAPTAQEKLDKPDALTGTPEDMKQMVGISDPHAIDTESWAYIWANPDDAEKMKSALESIAEHAAAPPSPAANMASSSQSTHHTTHHKPVAPQLPMLADEEFHAYSLSFGGGATMVLTARTAAAPVKYITIVAQPDFYGQPQVILKRVTSDNEMDVLPRMQLVDAADTQGSGRADLIFELRGRTFRQFAIYSIAGGSATQAFVTQPASD